MFSFKEFFHQINKKLIGTYGKYKAFLVDGKQIRDLSKKDEEFGGCSIHAYNSVIPDNEIWVEKDTKQKEIPILVAISLFQLKEIANGVSKWKTYDKSLKKEKAIREKIDHIKFSGSGKVPEKVYVKKYGMIGNTTVWLVDGDVVRDKFKTDFVEGGNSGPYFFVPKNEIWIEDGLDADEIPYVILHEFSERKIMADRGLKYDKAHEMASKIEFKAREKGFSKQDALNL